MTRVHVEKTFGTFAVTKFQAESQNPRIRVVQDETVFSGLFHVFIHFSSAQKLLDYVSLEKTEVPSGNHECRFGRATATLRGVEVSV